MKEGKLPQMGCVSNERFVIEVMSDTREDVSYEVSLGKIFNHKTEEIERRWTCSCRGFMAHIGKPGHTCKHIRRVKENDWCGWKHSVHGGRPIKHISDSGTDYTCPNCSRLAYPEEDIAEANRDR